MTEPREHCGYLSPETGLSAIRTECVLRPGHSGSHADEVGCRWWPIAEERAVSSAGPAPATDRDTLRDRIAEALIRWTYRGQEPDPETGILETVRANAYSRADAVLAVLPAPDQQAAEIANLRTVYDAVSARENDLIQERDQLLEAQSTVRAAVFREAADELGRMDFDTDSNDYGYDTYRDAWNGGVMDGAALLRRLAGEAQQDPRCTRCTHPKRDHDGRADHRAKYSPLVAGEPWCHACNAECDYTRGAQQDPTQDGEAHPPQHAWRVETRDPLANEWAPGSHFASRPHAVERYETANRTAPLWRDGTPVERRIVRETTTYTVEPPTAVARSGQPETDTTPPV